jgi:hypothetical protein
MKIENMARCIDYDFPGYMYLYSSLGQHIKIEEEITQRNICILLFKTLYLI